MSERANYFKLGLFVIVATLLLLAVVALLGARSIFRRTEIIETCFKESVQGLDVGSAVKLRGVQLGRVHDIRFALDKYGSQAASELEERGMENFVIVEMAIELGDESVDDLLDNIERDVREGLRARMAMAGLTGGVFLELTYLDPGQNPAMSIPWTPTDPYVPSAQSVLGQITSAAERIAREIEDANLGETLSNVGILVKNLDAKLQQVDVATIQGDVIDLVQELRATNRRVQQVLENPAVDATLADVAATMGSLRGVMVGGEADLQRFVHDLPEVTARAKATLADLEALLTSADTRRTLANLAKASDSAPAAMEDLRDLMRRVDSLVMSQQGNLEAIVVSLRSAMANLDALSADAARNPARLLFGEPPPHLNPAAGGAAPAALPPMRK